MTRTSQTTEDAPPTPSIPWWRRLANRVWGYDFFISYHWASGGVYAVKLAEELRARRFDCFLDRSEFASGDDWKHQAHQALANTQGLIVIGTREALSISNPVRDEVTAFISRSERIIPILFGTRIPDSKRQNYPTLNLISNRIVEIVEQPENQTFGPSEATLERIEHGHSLLRRRKLRAVLVTAVVGVLTILTVAATLSFFTAESQRSIAQDALVEIQHELAQSLVDQAVQELEHGDRAALLRLAEAYEISERLGTARDLRIPPDQEMSRSARRLLAGWGRCVGFGLPHADQIFSASLSPDGSLVRTHTMNIDGEPTGYRFWDAQTGRPLGAIGVDDSQPELVMAPDWSTALHWTGLTLRRLSVLSGELVELVLAPDDDGDEWQRPQPYHTGDGSYAAISEGDDIAIWNLETGGIVSTLAPSLANTNQSQSRQ